MLKKYFTVTTVSILVSVFLLGCDGSQKKITDTTAPTLELVGNSEITVAQGSTYTDQGATSDDGTISVTGTVDTSVISTYTLTYNAVDAAGNSAPSITRTIHVTDQTAPSLELVGNSVITVPFGSTFTDPGAISNDGTVSISGTVNTSAINSYTLTYNAVDSAGNSAPPITRLVHVTDQDAPTISLLGEQVVKMTLGETYEDDGATANDNVDGSSSVSTTDSVNTSKVGVYTLKYNKTDASGNVATEVERTVEVRPYDLYDFDYYNNAYHSGLVQFNLDNMAKNTYFIFTQNQFVEDVDSIDVPEHQTHVLIDGDWVNIEGNIKPYELTVNGFLLYNTLQYTIEITEELGNKAIQPIEDSNLEILMPEGAQRVSAIGSFINDHYQIDNRAYPNGVDIGRQYFESLSEVIKFQCGTHTFDNRGFSNGEVLGIGFTCGQEGQTEGTLIGKNDDGSFVENVGTWEIKNLPGSTVQAIIPSVNDEKFVGEDSSWSYFYAIKDGEVWIGEYILASSVAGQSFTLDEYNKLVFDAVEQKIIDIQ